MKGSQNSPTVLIVIVVIILGFAWSVLATTSSQSNANKTVGTTSQKTVKNGTYTETATKTIEYETKTIKDGSIEYGKTVVQTNGVNGEKTVKYNVTYEDGKEVSRKVVSEEVTKKPVTKIIAEGTKVIWRCTDVTSYDRNPYNDNLCISSTGERRYVSDSVARILDPDYPPGQSGHPYYNSF